MNRQNQIKGRGTGKLRLILEELLDTSLRAPRYPMRKGLPNGLALGVMTSEGKVHLQISRPKPGPSGSEWNTVLSNWPFPCEGIKPVVQHYHGAIFWSAAWPVIERQTEHQGCPETPEMSAGAPCN